MNIQGFDPLGPIDQDISSIPSKSVIYDVLEEAIRRTVINILKSYAGFYDLFSEAIQNALDAVQWKKSNSSMQFQPKIWIYINLQDNVVRIVDNGIGMMRDEFLLCFRPNISFKRSENLRGNKGVGATFLAYGYNYVHLQSKKVDSKVSAIIRNGRQWAEDQTGRVKRPRFEEDEFSIPELENDASGTSIEIRLTGFGGEKPKDLGWQGATNAEQWFDILRIVTPLGGTYLRTTKFKPQIYMQVIDRSGTATDKSSHSAEYYYPHEIPNLKVTDLSELRQVLSKLEGDPRTMLQKLSQKYQNIDCLYDIWSGEELIQANPPLKIQLTEEQKALIDKHKVVVYAAHLHSVKTFDALNESLGLRKNIQIMRGGLQMASDFMPQGELLPIPLKRYIGYQRNTLVVVHFTQGTPDLGRKTFQPELRELAEILAEGATKVFIDFRWLFKPDTGATKSLTPSKQLHQWIRKQELWRDQNPLTLEGVSSTLGYLSAPREEQDVVALYNQFIGANVIRGITFYSSEYNETYDALIEFHYTSGEDHLFDKVNNPFGVRIDIDIPYESEPKVLEYKYDLDALIRDLDNETKFADQIDLVVCWKASGNFTKRLLLKSYLLHGSDTERIFYGATHKAFLIGQYTQPVFEVVILEDLVNYMLDKESEKSRQKIKYDIQ